MKCVIVDDERPALEILAVELAKCEGVEIVGKYLVAEEMLNQVSTLKPDAIFLDVQMPTLDGLQLISLIRTSSPTSKIIFVTAHANYAVDAYEEEIFDFVLKPVYNVRLQKTLDRLRKFTPLPLPKVKCFGKLELEYGENKLQWTTQKAEELFAFLLVNDEVSVEQLQDEVFSEFSLEKSKQYIYTCVYMIRNNLRKIELAERIRIESGSGFYRLKLKDVESEWKHLQTRTIQGKAIEAKWAIERLPRTLFSGLDSFWIYHYRHQAEQTLLKIVMDELRTHPLDDNNEVKNWLFLLKNYLPSDEPFWTFMIQRLNAEQLYLLANEIEKGLLSNSKTMK